MSAKKKCIFLVLLFVYLAARGQNISVADFSLAENDVTAMQQGTSLLDQNGDRCAIIKIETSVDGLLFEVGSLGVKKVERHGGEIWLYVPHGIRKMTISHQQLGVLRDWSIPVSVNAGRTYVMKLTTGEIITTVKEVANKQYLVFNIEPKNATLEVDKDLWPLDEFGHAEKLIAFGNYTYNISAKNYHATAGKVTIDDAKNKKVITLSLRPAFGWLEIGEEGNLSGADVYIDNENVGKVPLKTDAISSGTHKVRISKQLYKTYEATIQIQDSTVSTLTPNLEPVFAETILTTSSEADIYIDGILKGKGQWNGPLEYGQYTVECKQENHRSTSQVVNITASTTGTIQLQQPIPIMGSVEIKSKPSDASVTIDGKTMGTTPLFINNDILIGQHTVTFTKSSYRDTTINVVVKEKETEVVNVSLSKVTEPDPVIMPDKTKSDETKPDNNPEVVKPKKEYFKKHAFYIAGGYQVGGLQSVGGNIGVYLGKFNIEASYMHGLEESEMIYWNAINSSASSNYCDNYKAHEMTLRIGYSIQAGSQFRFVPRIGVGVTELRTVAKLDNFDKSYAVNAKVGVSAELALSRHFSIFARPEYSFAVSQGEMFEALSDVSSDIKGYATGFNAMFGIQLTF